MIEMEKTSSNKRSISVKRKKEKRAKGPTSEVDIVQSRFYDELRIAEVQDLHIEFDNLVAEITKKGEEFAQDPTPELLTLYKSMIGEFLQYVTDRMFQVEHHAGGRLKQKIYTVTKIIDERLSALTEMVLSQQADNISLLATLDEIRGILVDLYK